MSDSPKNNGMKDSASNKIKFNDDCLVENNAGRLNTVNSSSAQQRSKSVNYKANAIVKNGNLKSTDDKNDIIYGEYIYLVQEREFMKTKEFIFKVGKTAQKPYRRMQAYPKESRLLLTIIVNDCSRAEYEILKIFRSRFKQRIEIGDEYFEGDPIEMIDVILDYQKKHFIFEIAKGCLVQDNDVQEEISNEEFDVENNDVQESNDAENNDVQEEIVIENHDISKEEIIENTNINEIKIENNSIKIDESLIKTLLEQLIPKITNVNQTSSQNKPISDKPIENKVAVDNVISDKPIENKAISNTINPPKVINTKEINNINKLNSKAKLASINKLFETTTSKKPASSVNTSDKSKPKAKVVKTKSLCQPTYCRVIANNIRDRYSSGIITLLKNDTCLDNEFVVEKIEIYKLNRLIKTFKPSELNTLGVPNIDKTDINRMSLTDTGMKRFNAVKQDNCQRYTMNILNFFEKHLRSCKNVFYYEFTITVAQ